MDSKELLDKISSLEEEVYNYITTTDHWLFYWIDDVNIQNFIRAYPEDYEDRVRLEINSISNPSVWCIIHFDNHPDDILYLDRYVILTTFKNRVNAKCMGWGGKLKEIQIQEKEGELIYHKNKVTELEKDIEKLKAQD